MHIASFKHRDYDVAESAKILADALQPHLDTAVTVADAAAMTGLPFEEARSALAYLAVRNAAHVTFVDDEIAYVFPVASATVGGLLPSKARSFMRYVGDLFASQLSYLMGAVVAVGPAFIGASMFLNGFNNDILFDLIAGGTLAFASLSVILIAAVRSIGLLLPPLIAAGIALGWEQWTSNDLYWLPVVCLVAIAMQADVLLHFRENRPEQSLRQLFWGRGLSEPVRDRKRLVELVTSLGGIVTVGDLMRTYGWDVDEAGERLAEILLEYGGDVAIDRQGRMYLRFDALAESRIEGPRPRPAYELERKAPGPFHGLDVSWVILVAVACWIGIVGSPLNPVYSEVVAGVDFTLEGVGRIVRATLGLMFGVPLLVYIARLVFNFFDRAEFGERRQFLDALEFADHNAKGVLVAPDKLDNKTLARLNATIDEERSVPHAMWVEFRDLQPPVVDEEQIFAVYDKPEEFEFTDTAPQQQVRQSGVVAAYAQAKGR